MKEWYYAGKKFEAKHLYIFHGARNGLSNFQRGLDLSPTIFKYLAPALNARSIMRDIQEEAQNFGYKTGRAEKIILGFCKLGTIWYIQSNS